MKKSIIVVSAILVFCLSVFAGAGVAVNENYIHCDNAVTLQKMVDNAQPKQVILIDCSIQLDKQIEVNRDVTIDLQGNTISSKGNSRVFFVTDSGSLWLYNGTLSGGYAKYDAGGAIFVRNGGLMTDGVTICDCKARDGGAVAVINGEYTMNNTVISNCIADDERGSSYEGGGVYIDKDSTFTMSSSTIKDCMSDDYGGGLYVYGKCSISDSIITSCRVDDYYGGAICCYGCNLNMNRSNIADSSAESGGGIYAIWSKINLNDVTINKCVADGSYAFGCYKGGAIYSDLMSILTMTNSVIKDCIADDFGGGLFTRGGGCCLDHVRIENCKADDNAGGGIRISEFGTVLMYNSCITGCKADDKCDSVSIDKNGYFRQENCNIEGVPDVIVNRK